MSQQTGDQDIEALIARIGLSDKQAFDRLYSAASPKLFAVLIRILKDRSRAEDALQDVFVKVWQKSRTFRAESQAPMAWLVTIARNHAIDVIRSERRVHEDIDQHLDLASGEMDPQAAAEMASERERIEKCLEELDPQRAEAVVSAYVEGFSYQELADRYSIPLNTMRTWLRRSLISLRECLDHG